MRTGFINAKILTNDNTFSEAMIINNNIVEYVGETAYVKNQDIKIIDLEGKSVLPGFYDSHMHFLGIGLNENLSDLSKSKSIEEFISTLSKNKNDWIVGRGWHQSNLNGITPTKSDLDKVSKDKPVISIRVCGHVLVANSKAIEISGINKDTEQVSGGHFDIDTGIFEEDALLLITKNIPPYSKEDIKSMFINANKKLVSKGITYIASDDFSTLNVPYELILDILEELYNDKLIDVRLYEQVNLPTLELFKDYISKGYPNKIYNDKFKLGPLKLLADGSLGGRTAYLRENYNDKNSRGIPVFTQSTLNQYVKLSESSNMNVAIHAIGDATIDMILEATKESKSHRHGIIHAQIVDREQIKRINEQNLVLYIQPIFLNSDISIIEDRLGERSKESYLFKTMYDSGIITSFGTDAPVEDINPFENIYTAITRRSIKSPNLKPFLLDESFDILKAIQCYTSYSAYTSYDEESIGKIKPGFKADFIVIDKDISSIDAKELLNTNVLDTYINGKKVF